MELLESLKNSSVAWLVLSMVSIVALIFGFYSHFSNKRKQRFSFNKNSFVIIKQDNATIPKLNITYDGTKIPDLSSTKFLIWNSGNCRIDNDDIVSDEPLRIVSNGDAEILHAEIINESEPSNKISIESTESKCVRLGFDYVAAKDKLEVQVIHTGDAENITVDCKIKGGDKTIDFSSPYIQMLEKLKKETKVTLLSLVVVAILFGSAKLISDFTRFSTSMVSAVLSLLLGLLVLLFSFIIYSNKKGKWDIKEFIKFLLNN